MLPVGSNIERRELPFITLIIIGLNIIAFLFEAILSDPTLYAFLDAQAYGPRNWYNPFAILTSFFLHGSVGHLFGNMFFLWIFGAPIEERLGWKKYLGFYLGAGVASALLYVIMQFLQVGPDAVGAIGASGAVSGVMAIYIYRCYYAKLKMVIDPFFFKFKFDIPALPFVLLFYVLPDLYAGVNYPTAMAVAYWGHIGGFVFGIIAARISRFGHEGMIEQLREKVNQALLDGKGLAAVEKELLKIMALVPFDPEVKIDLARLYAMTERPREALGYYSEGISIYFAKQPVAGAYTVMECAEKLGKSMDFKFHLKAAEVMVREGAYADARRVMLMALKQKLTRSPVIERLLVLFVKVNVELSKDNDAKKAFGMLKQGFPKSKLLKDAYSALELPPGKIFPPPRPTGTAGAEGNEGSGKKAEKALGVMADIMEIIVDPFFIFAWFIIKYVTLVMAFLGVWPGFLAKNFYGFVNQIVIFVLTLGLVLEYHTRFLTGMAGRIEQRKAEKAFDATRTLEEARMSEKKEDFARAARLYEQHLINDPGDLVSRRALGLLYMNRLGKNKNATEHFQYIMETADPSSPIHGDATEALVKLEVMAPPETYGYEEPEYMKDEGQQGGGQEPEQNQP